MKFEKIEELNCTYFNFSASYLILPASKAESLNLRAVVHRKIRLYKSMELNA